MGAEQYNSIPEIENVDVRDLARRSFLQFQQDVLFRAPLEKHAHMEQVVRGLLWAGPDDCITLDTFISAFTYMEPFIQKPELLFDKAKDAVEMLHKGRESHLSSEERTTLAAFLCCNDVSYMKDLRKYPTISWTNDEYVYPNFDLVNPWYIYLPKYSSIVDTWNRKGDQYIQPRDHSLEEKIAMLASSSSPVLLLDAGTGGATYPKH